MRKLVLGAAGLAMAAIAGGAAWLLVTGEGESAAEAAPGVVDVGGADLGGPFTLTDQTGRRVTAEEVIDGPTLVYFGYTFCPDVCPIDTAIMVEATEMLAERGIEVTPVFVTVDPERDTPEALALWAEAMHPDLVALTGSPEAIAEAAEAYRVYYSRVEMPDSAAGYLMNHTAFTYFMTPDGIAGLFRHGVAPETIAAEVARTLGDRGEGAAS